MLRRQRGGLLMSDPTGVYGPACASRELRESAADANTPRCHLVSLVYGDEVIGPRPHSSSGARQAEARLGSLAGFGSSTRRARKLGGRGAKASAATPSSHCGCAMQALRAGLCPNPILCRATCGQVRELMHRTLLLVVQQQQRAAVCCCKIGGLVWLGRADMRWINGKL